MDKKYKLFQKTKTPKKETTRSETQHLKSVIRKLQKENKRLRSINRDLKKIIERNFKRIEDLVEGQTLEDILEQIREEDESEEFHNS